MGDGRCLGLAVILEIGPEQAVRGPPLPQSLAGTGKKGLGGSSCQCEGLVWTRGVRAESDLHPRAG